MHYNAGEIFWLHFARPPADGHITKSLKRKMRLEGFGSLSFGGVPNRFAGRAQILRVEIPRFIKDFRVPQSNRGSCRGGYAETNPPHHVLPQVENRVPRGRRQNFYRSDFFDRFDRRARRRHQLGFWRLHDRDQWPVLLVEPCLVPARLLKPRIVGFPVINVGQEHRPGGGFPLVVARDDLLRAVLIGNSQLRQERQLLAVMIPVVRWIHYGDRKSTRLNSSHSSI